MKTSGTLVFAHVTITGPDVGPRTDTDSEPRSQLLTGTAGIHSAQTLLYALPLAYARAALVSFGSSYYLSTAGQSTAKAHLTDSWAEAR